jgi:hypothetical protein
MGWWASERGGRGTIRGQADDLLQRPAQGTGGWRPGRPPVGGGRSAARWPRGSAPGRWCRRRPRSAGSAPAPAPEPAQPVGPAATGDHRRHPVGPLGRGHQAAAAPVLAPNNPKRSSPPMRAVSQSMASTRRRASRAMSKRSSRLRRSSCSSSAVSRSSNRVPRPARWR